MIQPWEYTYIDFFPRELAHRICGPNKQNAVIMVTGPMGTGKSYTVLEFARLCAKYISKILGTHPSQHFNMDTNVGIMVMDEISKVYEHMDTHERGIYIIDDAGATFNSRHFMSEGNIALNDRIQTMRPHQNIVIFTTPQKSLMDKVVRNLSTHMIFMKDPDFAKGITVCDIRKIEVALALDKDVVYRKFLQDPWGNKIKTHIFRKPPQDWCDAYDERRRIAEAKLAENSRKVVAQAYGLKEEKKTKTALYHELLEDFDSGAFGEQSLRQICITKGYNYQAVLNARASKPGAI